MKKRYQIIFIAALGISSQTITQCLPTNIDKRIAILQPHIKIHSEQRTYLDKLVPQILARGEITEGSDRAHEIDGCQRECGENSAATSADFFRIFPEATLEPFESLTLKQKKTCLLAAKNFLFEALITIINLETPPRSQAAMEDTVNELERQFMTLIKLGETEVYLATRAHHDETIRRTGRSPSSSHRQRAHQQNLSCAQRALYYLAYWMPAWIPKLKSR